MSEFSVKMQNCISCELKNQYDKKSTVETKSFCWGCTTYSTASSTTTPKPPHVAISADEETRKSCNMVGGGGHFHYKVDTMLV